jgi:hypothetical protein
MKSYCAALCPWSFFYYKKTLPIRPMGNVRMVSYGRRGSPRALREKAQRAQERA